MTAIPSEGREVFRPRRARLRQRNRAVAARYYYWAELRRRREDDVRRILCDNEFFVEERTIANALVSENDYLGTLIADRTSCAELRRLFPGFDWRK
ncbi:MAG: hypothetical protein K2F92_08010 [Alistipes sp.]|nr:hypothetical protein [Alistipes sp.]